MTWLNFFYFLFYPKVALSNWSTEMLHSVITSFITIFVGFVIYFLLRYNRKQESKRYFITLSLITLFNLFYVLWRSFDLPSEMLRSGYRFWYIFNHTFSTFVYSILFFYLQSTWIGAKRYFIRIHTYIGK